MNLPEVKTPFDHEQKSGLVICVSWPHPYPMSDGKKDVSTVAAKQPGVKKLPSHIVQPPKNIAYGPVVPHLKPGISHQLCSILLTLFTLKDLG